MINVYRPNIPKDRKEFLSNLGTHLVGKTNIVLGGDFNFIEDTNKDKSGGNPMSGDIGKKELADIRKTFSLTDAYRHLHSNDRKYTWSSSDGLISCRLDRFYVTNILLNAISDVIIEPKIWSDHCAVSAVLNLSPSKCHGPSFWKCNVSVLNDPLLSNEIELYFSQAKLKPVHINWFEDCKQECRKIIIKHSIRISSADKNRILVIESKLLNLENCKKTCLGPFKKKFCLLKRS